MSSKRDDKRVREGAHVLVCVCGGIAAYKVAMLVSRLVQAGAKVTVAMTPAATRFVTPLRSGGQESFVLRARAFDTGGNATWTDPIAVTLVADAVTTVGDLLRFNALWPSDAPEVFEGDLLELGP